MNRVRFGVGPLTNNNKKVENKRANKSGVRRGDTVAHTHKCKGYSGTFMNEYILIDLISLTDKMLDIYDQSYVDIKSPIEPIT